MTRPKKTTPGANIPAQLSVADAAQLSECYSSLALSMSRISEIYKKVVENEGGLFPKKAPKDPNAPKKPFTPYIMFCNDERDNIRQKFPKYTSQQVSRELGIAWKGLVEEEKAVYLTRHIRDNERYARELEDYKAKLGPIAALEASGLPPAAEISSSVKQAFDSESSDENLDSRKPNSKSKGRVKFSASSASEDEYEIEDDGEAKVESLAKRSKVNGHSQNGSGNKKRLVEEPPSITPTPESSPPPPSRERINSQRKKTKKRMK